MIRKLITVTLVISVFLNCNSPSNNPSVEISFNDKEVISRSVKASKVFNACDSIMNATTILCISDKIIINEMSEKGSFHIVDLNNESYIGVYGSNGRGPGEISMPWSIMKSREKVFQIHDLQQRKVVSYDLDSLDSRKGFIKEIQLNRITDATDIFIKQDRVFYLSSTQSANRIYISDFDGKNIEGIGEIPVVNDGFPENTFVQGHSAKIIFNHDFFALGYKTTPLIQIFNNQTKKSILIKGPEQFPSIFENHKHPALAIGYNDETRIGYTDIRITSKYIYALYSGKKIFGTNNINNNIIYKFDFNGKPLEKITLDIGLMSFDVVNNQFIYGINMGSTGKYELLKYEIVND